MDEVRSGATVELLNEIGARNAIGRVDLVENRFVGMKSRGFMKAWRNFADCGASRTGSAVPGARGSTLQAERGAEIRRAGLFRIVVHALREALDAFVASTQTEMTGSVTLSLYKGNVSIVSRQSEHSLYRTDLSSFTMGDSYDRKTRRDLFGSWDCLRHARAARVEVAR